MMNFFANHYLTMVIIVMIFIFALIGRYVDKIGFFVSYKPKPKEKIDLDKLREKEEQDKLNAELEEATEEVTTPEKIDDIDSALFASIDSDPEYEKLRREVNSMLSKKDTINEDLLSDIEHLSLDKTQTYNFQDIPDLDDVELPEIKKEKEPEDIWKF